MTQGILIPIAILWALTGTPANAGNDRFICGWIVFVEVGGWPA
jgi:hypothetical protein